MSLFPPPRTLAGVDGCRGGWVAVTATPGGALFARRFAGFADILAALDDDAVIAVDMPIGLPARAGPGGRGPEMAARRALARFRSSVFSIPSRCAVHAEPGPLADAAARRAAHARTSALARETSDPPRGVSIQAFGILPKIREVDALLRAVPDLSRRVVESHPELVFQRLGAEHAPRRPKRTPEGGRERRTILRAHGLPEALLASRFSGVQPDDLLDAAALLFTAVRFACGEAKPLPDPFERDEHGLPMAIWL